MLTIIQLLKTLITIILKALGQHILVEFYGCPESVMKDNALIEKVMNEAAEESGATIVGSHFHTFNPYSYNFV